MKEELKVIKKDNKIKIESEIINIDWILDTKINRKILIIILRSMCKKNGEKLFSFKELAKIVNSINRQAASQYFEYFITCGKDLTPMFLKKRKLNDSLYELLLLEIKKEPMISIKELMIILNTKLSRTDISESNIMTLLDMIPYGEVRKSLKKQIEIGEVHYKESYLLKQLFQKEESKENPKQTQKKIIVPRDIKKLFDVKGSVNNIKPEYAIVIFCMTLYNYGVHLSVLGRWLNVNKSTILRWIISMSTVLWEVINNWIYKKVISTTAYIDEKWIKIRGKWVYWFVVIDAKTGIPFFSKLLPNRSKYTCSWLGLKLKQIGRLPNTIITDGLVGYNYIKNVKHLLCLFHHQQNVTKWIKNHFTKPKIIEHRKKIMKKLFQTNDKRTVKRRFEKLKKNAKKLGIEKWIEIIEKRFKKLLPIIGSKKFPTTSNCIERFFGNFNRFYKIRRGFHSIVSAKKELVLFLVMYMFLKQTNGKAPIEKIMPKSNKMPLYILINNPIQALKCIQNVKLSPEMTSFSETNTLFSLNTVGDS